MSPRCHLRALGRVPCGRSSGIETGALSLVSCLSCLEVEERRHARAARLLRAADELVSADEHGAAERLFREREAIECGRRPWPALQVALFPLIPAEA
jgi:hypothetical protein